MPGIAPLPAAERRPGWSVMLPTYNRARHLEMALRSVLEQDPGPDRMQIEVIDNSSTGEVREVVTRLGSSRVQLFYVAEHMRMTTAMTRCVERARGQWVHILHDDDYTHPGFYQTAAEVFTNHPEVGAVLCRNEAVDQGNRRLALSRLARETPGVLDGWLETIAVINHGQYVSTAVRREVFEAVGPFDERLTATADWDMWKRIAARFPFWYLPQVLASYRVHADSDTSRSMPTGALVADTRRAIELSAEYLPAAAAPRLICLARRHHARVALQRGLNWLRRGERSAGWTQLREGWKTYPSAWFVLRVMLGVARRGWRNA